MGGDDRIAWQRLREFAGVDLTRSFVLSWKVQSGTLVVDIDLFLCPEHPFYERPRPAEKVCIRPACIEFPWCDGLAHGDDEDGELADVAGRIPLGAITEFVVVAEGHYELHGEFGNVSIRAERPVLRLKGH